MPLVCAGWETAAQGWFVQGCALPAPHCSSLECRGPLIPRILKSKSPLWFFLRDFCSRLEPILHLALSGMAQELLCEPCPFSFGQRVVAAQGSIENPLHRIFKAGKDL